MDICREKQVIERVNGMPNPKSVYRSLKSSLQLWRDVIRRKIGILLFDTTKTSVTPQKIDRIVLVRWDAKLGDAIVSSWFFREIKKAHPKIRIEVITTPGMAWLFRDHFGADKIYESKKRPSFADLHRLCREIAQPDLLIHFNPYLKLKDLFFLSCSKAPLIAGLDDEISLINLKYGKITKEVHFSQKFRPLAAFCNVDDIDTGYIIPKLPECEERVESEWPLNSKVIAINPYGSGKSRRLNVDSIRRILDFLAGSYPDVKFCLLHSPEFKTEVAQLCIEYPDSVFYVASSTHIGDTIAQIRRSNAVISVDTSTVHIANGLQKPVFGLYNPSPENFKAWGPINTSDHAIFAAHSHPLNINLVDWEQFENEFSEWIKNFS